MPASPISKNAAACLVRQVPYLDTNTTVTIKNNTSLLTVHGKELAKLYYDPTNSDKKPRLKIRNEGFFTAVFLDRINAVLYRVGHETLYRKSFNWVFEQSQTPFGSGVNWKDISL